MSSTDVTLNIFDLIRGPKEAQKAHQRRRWSNRKPKQQRRKSRSLKKWYHLKKKRDQLLVGGRPAVQSQLQVCSLYSLKMEQMFFTAGGLFETNKHFNVIVVLVAGPEKRSGRVTRQSSK